MTKTERKSKSTEEGKFAKKVYDYWCNMVFPRAHRGDKYVGVGGRDMKHLLQVVKASQNMDPNEWARRLTRYATEDDEYLIKKGHALHLFTWNAYSDAMMVKRQQIKSKNGSSEHREYESLSGRSPL